MNRFNNGGLIKDIINGIKSIGNYSDFLKIREDLIYKLEILERNLENNNINLKKVFLPVILIYLIYQKQIMKIFKIIIKMN